LIFTGRGGDIGEERRSAERGADGAYFQDDKSAFLWIRTDAGRRFFDVGGNVRINGSEKTPCGSFVKNNLWNEVYEDALTKYKQLVELRLPVSS